MTVAWSPDARMKLAYTYDEAAREVGVSVQTIRRLVACGDLPVKYPTSVPVIPGEDLAAWFAALPSEKPARRA